MHGKRILVLFLVLLGLLAVAYLAGIFSGDSSTVDAPGFEMKDAELVSVFLKKDGDELVIEKQGDSWILTRPVVAPADTSRISTLIDGLNAITAEAVVSTNPERYGRYEVDDQAATVVRLGYGDQTQELYIGKTGPDFQSRYIRQGADERVGEATGVPNIIVTQDNWRDKQLWELSKTGIAGAKIEAPDGSYFLSLEAGGWSVLSENETFATDSSGVAQFLDRISKLSADGFLTELDADSIRSVADHSLEITLQNGQTQRINILKRESDLALTLDENADVFKLYSYRLAQLVPPIEDLTQ
jgi:antitoxin component of MazEF toxin-antitoxin module